MSAHSEDTQAAGSRPWHREPLVWMVIAIPALTVVAGLTTVRIAFHGADPVVADYMRKEGLAIHQDPTRDRAAAAAGVTAKVTLAADRIVVELRPGQGTRPDSLLVLLSHATQARYDQLLMLATDADGRYGATLPALPPGHWYLELSPADRAWRLTGELHGGDTTLTLKPRTRL